MIRSMTGFGRGRKEYPDKALTVEMKAVNSRYLEVAFKAPRLYAAFDVRVKQLLSEKGISRGKLDISVQTERKESAYTEIRVDEALAAGYLKALQTLRDRFALKDDITVMKLSENRDIFLYEKPEEDAEAEWAALLPVLEEAIAVFLSARETEGAALERDILSRLSAVEAAKDTVARLSDADKAAYRSRLEARLRQTIGDMAIKADEGRILTECAIFADRIAVDEETVRLGTHIDSFRRILAGKDPAGRKLDFLLQEMNRETNTIGSKCSNAEIAAVVVSMKCELEKIREQVQNIE